MENILSCDWGTTNFRLRLINTQTTEVLHEVQSAEGITATHQLWNRSGQPREAFYLSVIQKHVDVLKQKVSFSIDSVPVVISGMASSSLGIRELPYAQLPFKPDGTTAITATITDPAFDHTIYLVSGLRSKTDVMRGEETQWLGLMQNEEYTAYPDLLFILPGTHSKHITTSGGQINGFNTFMTGEFFSLLVNGSVLKNSVEAGHEMESEEDEASFIAGVKAAVAGGYGPAGNLLHTAFLVRTNELFGTLNRKQNAFFLSGLLIGCEIQTVKSKKIILASGPALLRPYGLALKTIVGPENIVILPEHTFETATIQGQIKVVKELIRYE
jgi:2-dehydro-3-deoxygalactonokinase